MQPRARDRLASVDQMQDIARNPDPGRLTFSRSPNTGAPMVSVPRIDSIPAGQRGQTDHVTMADGRKIPVTYAVVEADSVAASHDANGNVNTGYEQSERKALNNGRTAGIQEAYRRGTAQPYRDGLGADSKLTGVSPEAVAGLKNPMLVRLYDAKENTADIGAQSNVSDQLGMSATEQAKSDAHSLPPLDGIQFNRDGTIPTRLNADYYRAWFKTLGKNESASLMDANGQPNADAVRRLQAAIVAKAYGDERLLTAFAEEVNPDNRNILTSLVRAAPAFAKVEDTQIARDVKSALIDAFDVVREASARDMSVTDFVAQGDLLGRDESADAVAVFMDANKRSVARMATAYQGMAEYVEMADRHAATGDIFGEAPTPTVGDAIRAANQKLRDEHGDERQIPEPRDASAEVRRGQSEPDGRGRAETGDAEAAAAEGAQKETLSLTQQTEAERAAEEARVKAAQGEEANKAKAAEEKAKADLEASDFRLSGSDRPADVAAAGGQGDLLSPRPETKPTEPGQAPGSSSLVLASNGKPYVTERAAKAALNGKRLNGVPHEVVPVDGGFALRSVEKEQMASEHGSFGPIFTQFRHDAQGAINHLRKQKSGEAVAALHHPDVGDIDLVWGKEGKNQHDGFGLAKLIRWHPEVVDDLQNILESMHVTSKTANRIQLESDRYKGAVRLEWDGVAKKWLLTAFDKKGAASTRTDIAGNQRQDDSPAGASTNSIAIAAEASKADTSPTEAQKEAGNYQKGHIRIHGMDISIENPKGSTRSGVDQDGNEWSTKMNAHYGYIKRTEGADGDHVDVFIGNNPESDQVFVVDQVNRDGSFDEHKVMLGYNNQAEAEAGYLANYEKGQPLGNMTAMTVDQFKQWLADGNTKKPLNKQDVEAFGDDTLDLRRATDKVAASLRNVADSDIAKMPLSKIWPKSEIDAIENTDIAAFATVVRDTIPAKPRTTSRLNSWVGKVKAAREMMSDLSHIQDMLAGMRKAGRGLADLASRFDVLTRIDRSNWSRVGDVVIRADSYRLNEAGEKVHSPYAMVTLDGNRVMFRGVKDADGLVKELSKKLGVEAEVWASDRFSIYTSRRTGSHYIVRNADRNKTPLMTFDNIQEARDALKDADAIKKLDQAWEDIKARENVHEADVRRDENLPRTGKNWRKGKDVSSEQFVKTFGLRHVDFGKWVDNKSGERQAMLNETYDAFSDLADILGIPAEAIGLNGDLIVTLGKRGSGHANAHFERDQTIINLTKTKGAGSLAHEWFHALDNHFSRLRNQSDLSREKSYITYRPEPLMVHKSGRSVMTREELLRRRASEPGSRLYDAENWHQDTSHPEGVRPVVEKAFADLVNALNESPMKWRSQAIDGNKPDGYWSRIIERGARSFENYVIAKMDRAGFQNDFLANVQKIEGFKRNPDKYPYLLKEEQAPVEEAFDKLFQTIEAKKTDKGTLLFSRKNPPREFTPDPKEAEGFRAALERMMSSLRSVVNPVEIPTVSPVLRALGAKEAPISISRDVVRKATNDVMHEVTMEAIEALPEELYDPLMVFNSSTHTNALVAVTEYRDKSGAPVIVALDLRPTKSGYEVNKISSVYGKNGDSPFALWLNEGKLAYVSDRARSASSLKGLQLPDSLLAKASESEGVLHESDITSTRPTQKSQSGAETSSKTPAAAIRQAIRKAYGDLLDKLESKGLVTLHQTQDEALEALAQARAKKTGQPVEDVRQQLQASIKTPEAAQIEPMYSKNGDIEGFYDPATKTSRLIADGLTPETAPGTLMHEVGVHMAADKLANMGALVDRAGSLRQQWRGNKFVEEAESRMRAAGETSNEEFLAYVVTQVETARAKAPFGIRKLYADFVTMVKQWMNRHGLAKFTTALTPNDLAAIARANARRLADGQTAVDVVRRSRNNPAAVMAQTFAITEAEARQQFKDTEKAYGGKEAHARAKAAGKTKLNYNQWVQVRTPAFKRWFGDWETAAAKPTREAATFDEAREQAKAFQGKPLHNAATGIVATVSRNNLDKMLSKSAADKSGSPALHATAVANLDEMFSRAVLGWTKSDRNGDPSISGIHRLFTTMQVDGKAYIAKMTVKETARQDQPNPLYTVEAVTFDPVESPAVMWVDSTVRSDGLDPTSIRPAGLVESMAQRVQDFNPDEVSKVVDPETGEPMVVYHSGSPDLIKMKPGGRFDGALFVKKGSPANYGKTTYPLFVSGKELTDEELEEILDTDAGRAALQNAIGRQTDEDAFNKVAEELTNGADYPTDEDIWKAIGATDEADAAEEMQRLKIRLARELGYSSVDMADEFDGDTLAVVSPEAIKSAIGNTGQFGPTNDIRFSKRNLTTDQEEALSHIGVTHPSPSLPDRIAQMTDRFDEKFVQNVIDQFSPLKSLDMTSYMQARLSKGTDGALEATLLYGTPHLRDGAYDVNMDGGFASVLAELQGDHDNFLAWVAGNRSEQLAKEGREHLFSAKQIAALKSLNQGTMPDGTSRAKAYDKALAGLRKYQNAILDIAEQAGLIDKSQRANWYNDFYVPFYRELDPDDGKSTYTASSSQLVKQRAFQTLKGGDAPLKDLLENLLGNWSHLLTASMRNMAGVKALAAAEKAGIARKVQTAEKGSIWVMENGKQVHYMVSDPLVLDALTALNYDGLKGPAWDAMRAFKHALTTGVTLSPTFRVRNLIRDTLTTLAVSDDAGWNPIVNIFVTGRKATKKGSQTEATMLMSGGKIHFGAFNDGDQARNAQRLIDERIIPDHSRILTNPHAAKRALSSLWNWYQETGDRSETINRAVVYQNAIKAGKTHLEASYEARNLLDFTMTGKSAAIRALTSSVSFANARIQGMYRLYTGARANPIRFGAMTGVVALASVVLYAIQRDDDDYKALPDWVRDTYWPVKIGDKFYYIPKPFEIGALGSVAERSFELAMSGNDYQARDFGKSVVSIAMDQLSMNPIPQAFSPALQAIFDRDLFRGRSIDTFSESTNNVDPKNRYSATTSAGAVAVGRALDMSPRKVEFLVRGYLGWLGVQALNVSDLMMRRQMGMSANPNRDLTDIHNIFAVGDFVQRSGNAQSKYMDRFYETQAAINRSYADNKLYAERGQDEEYKRSFDDPNLAIRASFNQKARAMSKLNAMRRRIMFDPDMTAEEKNKAAADIYQQMKAIALDADAQYRDFVRKQSEKQQ